VSATQPRAVRGTLAIAAPHGVVARPSRISVQLNRGGQRSVAINLTGTAVGTYQVPVTFTPDHGVAVTKNVELVVHPAVSDTNVALASQGAIATASSTEESLPQFTPDHAIDGDAATRWSSNYTDGEWLQVQLGRAQQVGKVVVQWELAHANAYQIQTSPDGTTWTTAATVADSQGGVETVWLDQNDVRYLRMQGVSRSTRFGYSIFEFRVYPAV